MVARSKGMENLAKVMEAAKEALARIEDVKSEISNRRAKWRSRELAHGG